MEFFLEAFNNGALAGGEDKTDASGPNTQRQRFALGSCPLLQMENESIAHSWGYDVGSDSSAAVIVRINHYC